jgi:mannose-6-phosphate isomerase-like protein (cupin superfamily)
MKTTFVLLAAVSILAIGCKSARTGWGRGESAQLPGWLQQFHRAVPFSDSVGWKAQAYRLPEPYEIPARRLIRQTSINKSAPIRVERYLEFDSLLIHAGTYQTPPGGSSFSVPVTFECRHWFVVSGDGQLVIQRLDFYDRQSARLQLVFRRSDLVAGIPDFALARPPAPDDHTMLQTFAIAPKPFFYRQILPDTLPRGQQVSIEHYWRNKDRLLHLGTEQHIVGSQKCFLIQMGGEHWLRATERGKTTTFRYILDETQPSLWQLRRFDGEPLWPPIATSPR